MPGPGGKEVGRVTVRVSPDSSSFDNELRRELKAKIAAIEASLDDIEVGADVDADGIRTKLKAIGEAAGTDFSKGFESKSSLDGSGFGDVTRDFRKGIKDTISESGNLINAYQKAFDSINPKTKKVVKNYERAGKLAGDGFLRGILRTRIDRSIIERIGFRAGSALSTPIVLMTRLAGAAVLATSAVGLLAGAVAPLVNILAGLSTQLATASGFLLAMPALLSAAAAGFTVLKVGLGPVLSALFAKTQEEVDKAYEKMSDRTKKFAANLRSLLPAFRTIRDAIQDNLLGGLSKSVLQLEKTLIPALRRGFGALATGMNAQLRAVLDSFNSPVNTSRIEKSLRRMGDAAKLAAPAMGNLVDIWILMTEVGSQMLPDLARGFSEVTKSWKNSLEDQARSGELLDKMRRGWDALKAIGRTTRDIFKGVANIFKIADAAGGGFFGGIEKGAASFRKFTESASGSEKIGAIFEAMNRAGKAVAPVLKAIGNGLVDIAPALASIAEKVSPGLEKLVTGFFDAFEEISPGVGDALGGIADSLGSMLPPLVRLIEPALELVNVVLKPMSIAVQALAPVLENLIGILAGIANVGNGTVGAIGILAGSFLLLRRRAQGLPGIMASIFGGRGARGAALAGQAAALNGVAAGMGRVQSKGRGLRSTFGRAGIVGLIVGATGSEELGGLLDNAVTSIGSFIDAGISGFKALGAAITGNEEALNNIRRQFPGVAKLSRDLFDDGIIGIDAFTNKLSGLNGKKWFDPITQRVLVAANEIERAATLSGLLDEKLGMLGATQKLVNLGVPIDVLNRAISRGLVNVPKVTAALQTIEEEAQGLDVAPRKLEAARAYIAEVFGKIETDMRTRLTSTHRSINQFTDQFKGVWPQKYRVAANTALKFVTTGMGGIVAQTVRKAKQATQGANNFKPEKPFKSGADKANSAVNSSLSRMNNIVRDNARRAAHAAENFPSQLRPYFNVDLSGSGRSTANSFISGLRSMIPSVGSAAGAVAAAAAGAFPNSPAKFGAFSGRGSPESRGRITANDFAKGLNREMPSAVRSAEKLMSNTASALSADFDNTVNSEGFDGLTGQITQALEGWQIKMDKQGVAKLANEGNDKKDRRNGNSVVSRSTGRPKAPSLSGY